MDNIFSSSMNDHGSASFSDAQSEKIDDNSTNNNKNNKTRAQYQDVKKERLPACSQTIGKTTGHPGKMQ